MSSRRLDSPIEGRFIVFLPPSENSSVSNDIVSVASLHAPSLLFNESNYCAIYASFVLVFFATRQNVQKFVFYFSLFSYFIPTRTEGHRVRSMLCLCERSCGVCLPVLLAAKCGIWEGKKKTAAECLISRGEKKQNSRYSEHFMAQMWVYCVYLIVYASQWSSSSSSPFFRPLDF